MLTLVFAGRKTPLTGTGREVDKWADDNGKTYARAFSSGALHWIEWLGLGVFAFAPRSRELRVWPKSDTSHEAIVDIFSVLQPLILQALGWQALHAGAALVREGAFAFCGRSGAGKSTLAFAMQQAGYRQIADD